MPKIWPWKKKGSGMAQECSSSSTTEPAHNPEMERLRWENQSLTAKFEQLQVKIAKIQRANESNTQISVYEFLPQEIYEATENFKIKIGEGGFGSVYIGNLSHIPVAIKQYSESEQGRAQFLREATILAKVRHPNIVALLGICPDVLCLVYEFLPNGNLKECLKKGALNWQLRTRILGDVYIAVEYLHSLTPERIVHGDLKPENILVDAYHVGKLIDFGISRFASLDGQGTATYHTEIPLGTNLFVDPEFIVTGDLTAKSDAYSFGIVILCVLTGRRPMDIANTVKKAIDDGTVASLVDKSVADWPEVHFKKWAQLGVRLATMERQNRPHLAEVSKDIMQLVKSAKFATQRGAFANHRR